MESRRQSRFLGLDRDAIEQIEREALTMVMYLAIVILAVHLARGDDATASEDVALIWGTAVGLGLAHLFAYDLAAVFAQKSGITREELLSSLGMVAAVVATSVVAILPYLFIGDTDDAATMSSAALGGLIGLTAYSAARRVGANRSRALLMTFAAVGLAAAVVVVKFLLTH